MKDKKSRVHQKLNTDELFYLLRAKDEENPVTLENPEEYGCDCLGKYCNGAPASMNVTLVAKIDELEKLLQMPLTVISGVRCEKQNIEVDGSDHSFHLLGRAADIRCESMSVDELAEAVEIVGLLVIRDYQNNVVHCQWND